jgi:DNA polymerase III alpha subunit (gram-positive type)
MSETHEIRMLAYVDLFCYSICKYDSDKTKSNLDEFLICYQNLFELEKFDVYSVIKRYELGEEAANIMLWLYTKCNDLLLPTVYEQWSKGIPVRIDAFSHLGKLLSRYVDRLQFDSKEMCKLIIKYDNNEPTGRFYSYSHKEHVECRQMLKQTREELGVLKAENALLCMSHDQQASKKISKSKKKDKNAERDKEILYLEQRLKDTNLASEESKKFIEDLVEESSRKTNEISELIQAKNTTMHLYAKSNVDIQDLIHAAKGLNSELTAKQEEIDFLNTKVLAMGEKLALLNEEMTQKEIARETKKKEKQERKIREEAQKKEEEQEEKKRLEEHRGKEEDVYKETEGGGYHSDEEFEQRHFRRQKIKAYGEQINLNKHVNVLSNIALKQIEGKSQEQAACIRKLQLLDMRKMLLDYVSFTLEISMSDMPASIWKWISVTSKEIIFAKQL